MVETKKISEYLYEVEKTGDMNVPLKIFASEKLMDHLKKDKSIQQGTNVACLPGIVGASIMLPDAHQGYGFSIGGVAAFDLDNGIITPGGIGFDINCGVRLLSTDLLKEEVMPNLKPLIEEIFKKVPSGVGSESEIRLSDEDLDDVLKKGSRWAVDNGYGIEDDLNHCESQGILDVADPSKVTRRAKARGRKQLGTLGAGNHFLEVQVVDEIFDCDTAKVFGIRKKGQVMVMIHCGSRGLGHQVCSDYLRKMEESFPEIMVKLPEKDLIYAPFSSKIGQDYFHAMSAAANYAWANRHIIAHNVRSALNKIFPDANIDTVYDVAHNIAKIEDHMVNGENKRLIVHRKGATRAFSKGQPDLPEDYKKIGQPILLPGSMGTSSYVLVGTEKAMASTFGSTAHGAGRVMSRFAARKQFKGETIKRELEQDNIFVKSASWKGISEEAPKVYKDIDEVVKVSHDAGIGKIVARLKPLGVIKG